MERENTKRKPPSGSPGSGRVDWRELHRRLNASQIALERRLNPTTEEKQKILRQRAQLLAEKSISRTVAAQSRLEIVEFTLASEHYGIEVGYISGIHPLHELTAVPCTPKFVLGLANIRGQILPIVDIKKLFDLPEGGLTDLNKVICVRANEIELGILADAIVDVRWISVTGLSSSLPTLTGIRAEYLKGVTEDSLVMLDVAKILSDENIIVDKSRATAG
jgi:purine-binding chemotaxis protein CheW